MIVDYISSVITRELRALRSELECYADEADIWKTPDGITNSAGTLALHLAGNLRHYIGTVLGGNGYVRDRAAEFARRDVPREELIADVDRAIEDVTRGLSGVSDEALGDRFPQTVADISLDTGDFLIHLASHLAYHLGQINYHRRITTKEQGSVTALSVSELSSAEKGG